MTTSLSSWEHVDSAATRSDMGLAAEQMGSFVRSTLGPLGRDKMVVRRMEDDEIRAMVTSDGIAIIEEFEGETDHPVANRFIDLAEAQEDDYGDGTTLVVLLASELLSRGVELVDRGVHPSDVIEGYSIGAQRTLEQWTETAIPLSTDRGLDRDLLEQIAICGMTNGRNSEWPLDAVAGDVVDAVLRVSDPERKRVRLSYANTLLRPGGNVTDTTVLDGAVIPEDLIGYEYLLPMTGRVLLVGGKIGARAPKMDVNLAPETAEDAGAFKQAGRTQAKAIAERIATDDLVAVVAGGDVDHAVAVELGKRGVVCVRNAKDSRIDYLSQVTGGKPISGVSPTVEIAPSQYGYATVHYHPVKLDDDWLAFSAAGTDAPSAATILVRGGTERTAQEAERRIKHGKNALRACIVRPEALAAGGAADIDAARAVRELAPSFDGREQLAVDAFADTLESIPQTLATNAGIDPIDGLVDLRTRHERGNNYAGITGDGEIIDNIVDSEGAMDPFLVRTTSLVRSVEFVRSLLRIDGKLVSTKTPTLESLDSNDD